MSWVFFTLAVLAFVVMLAVMRNDHRRVTNRDKVQRAFLGDFESQGGFAFRCNVCGAAGHAPTPATAAMRMSLHVRNHHATTGAS